MAKLYFYYSAMNAGKSTALLQLSFNYQERGMNTLIFTAELDNRYGKGIVKSRTGLEANAHMFNLKTDILNIIENYRTQKTLHCVLIDEAQFLTKTQVTQLTNICDEFDIPVFTYGLRSDFQGNLFEGSQNLLRLADELKELKTICTCGKKATMNLRIDKKGNTIKKGAQTHIGGNDSYISLCRKHFFQKLL